VPDGFEEGQRQECVDSGGHGFSADSADSCTRTLMVACCPFKNIHPGGQGASMSHVVSGGIQAASGRTRRKPSFRA
jgi:hypothetical protein